MEITCDILKCRQTAHQIPEHNIRFQQLDLKNICKKYTYTDLNKIIADPQYINVTTLFIDQYIERGKNDTELPKAILFAYGIASFSDVMFDSYKTLSEQRLIVAANTMVCYIEKIIGRPTISSTINDEFINAVDHYYSLYKIWNSQQSIYKINSLFEALQNNIQLKKLKLRSSQSSQDDFIDDIYLQVEKMIKLDCRYALKIILQKYFIFDGFPTTENYFWKNVNKIYANYNAREIIFLTIMTELKIKLLHILEKPEDRKELYYGVDNDDIVYKIRNNTFSHVNIAAITDLLQKKPTLQIQHILSNILLNININTT